MINRTRRSLLGMVPALLATAAFGAAACATANVPFTSPSVRGGIASLELYDRVSGATLPVYSRHSERFVVGNPGSEYRMRLRNLSGARILVVASVDGVNIISGETATPEQSGYVLGPWESVDVDGWRKNFNQTAAFFFTDLANSYAARTGRPNDVGVIGVAVFQERQRVAAAPQPWFADKLAKQQGSPTQPAAAAPREEMRAEAQEGDQTSQRAQSDAQSKDRAAGGMLAQRAVPAPSLGTGHGRIEESSVRRVDFVRSTSAPVEVLAVRYDRRDNLVAMGVIPAPRVIGRGPDPFPGMRFTPDPR